jgi:hypothetical protein
MMDYAINGEPCTLADFAAWQRKHGAEMDAHGHFSNESRGYSSLLEPPLTDSGWAWDEHLAAKRAERELKRRGALQGESQDAHPSRRPGGRIAWRKKKPRL